MNSKTKLKLKPIIDILMTFVLLLLMSYELLGSTAHEVVGVVMFVLFVIHHTLNNWAKHLAKGRQTPIRIFQNILVMLVLISFVGSIVSGVAVSRHLFAFLNINQLMRRTEFICFRHIGDLYLCRSTSGFILI